MRFRGPLACLASLILCSLVSEAQGQAPPAQPPSTPAQPPADAVPPAAKTDPAKPTPPAGTPPTAGPPPAGAQPPQPEQQPSAPPPEATPPAELAADPAAPAQPPPIQQQPTAPPSIQPIGVTADSGGTPDVKKPVAPPETTLGIEVDVGINGRLGSGNEGFDTEDPAGVAYVLGAWLAPDRVYSVGLAYQRTGLGGAETEPLTPSVAAQYDLNTIWLGGRAYPIRNDHVGMFLQIMVGGSWQDVRAQGTRATGEFTTPAESFSCSASDGPGFSLSGGVGVDADIDRRLAFLAGVDAGGHQQSGEVVDDCTLGVGSVTSLSARIGFMYRFDLDDDETPAARSGRRNVARRQTR